MKYSVEGLFSAVCKCLFSKHHNMSGSWLLPSPHVTAAGMAWGRHVHAMPCDSYEVKGHWIQIEDNVKTHTSVAPSCFLYLLLILVNRVVRLLVLLVVLDRLFVDLDNASPLLIFVVVYHMVLSTLILAVSVSDPLGVSPCVFFCSSCSACSDV